MKPIGLAIFLLSLLNAAAWCTVTAQTGQALSGGEAVVEGVVETTDGETLPGAHIAIPDLNIGTSSDADGRFTLAGIQPGRHFFTVSMVGYRTYRDSLRLSEHETRKLLIRLVPLTVESDAVVVTASRRSQLAGRVPVSMSTVSSDEIRSRNITALDQALHNVPGVQVTGNQVNIRGSSGFAYGVGSRVLLLVDGVPLMGPDQESMDFDGLPLTQVRQIEVLKSPGSALYGGGALGGVINLITRDFPDRPETTLRFYTGAYQPVRHSRWRESWEGADQYRPSAGFTFGHAQKVGDRFGFWVSGMLQTDSGYLQHNSQKSAEGYAKLGWTFREDKSLQVYTGLRRSEREQFLYWNGIDDVLRPGTAGIAGETASGANDGVSDRLTILPVFTHNLSPDLQYTLKGRVFGAAFKPLDDDGTIRPRSSHTYGIRYGSELQVNSTPTEDLELTGGLSFDANWVESEFFVGDDSLTVRDQPEGSVFFQADYEWSDRLATNAGFRYDAYRVHTRDVARRFSPKLGISYQVSNRVTARASFGQGFRVPSVAERFVSNRDFLPLESNITLRPELSTGFEAGLNIQTPLGSNLGLLTEITGFWNTYEELVEPRFVQSLAAFQFVNLTSARIRGVETVFNLSTIDRRRQLRLSHTWLDAKDQTLDLPLLYRPEHLLQASGRIYLLNWLEAGADFRASSAPERVDTDFSLFVPDADLFPAVYVADLRLRFHWEAFDGVEFSGSLHLNNLFDYYYVERPALFAPPRNGQISIEARF